MRHKFDCARFFDLTSGCFQISDVYQAQNAYKRLACPDSGH
ncbi:hypothetical protein EMIT0P201_12743 [Pseudomonas chlororaphis]